MTPPTATVWDTGSTAWMLSSAALVLLMVPGLAFFYGGLVGRKNVLTIMMQSFVSMGWTTVLWFAFGYSLCFSGDSLMISTFNTMLLFFCMCITMSIY